MAVFSLFDWSKVGFLNLMPYSIKIIQSFIQLLSLLKFLAPLYFLSS